MKNYHVLLCSLSLLAGVIQADASTLYGSTSAGGPGELWILNPTNGATIHDVGPLNDTNGANYAVTGLAFSPVTGVLYGSTGNRSGQLLLTINPSNAQVTVVGGFNAASGATMADIAFDSSGNLYGVGSIGGAALYSINTATGQAVSLGDAGFTQTAGGGLAISPANVFYSTPLGKDLGTFNPTTGAFTFIGNIATPAGANASYAALAFDGNTLYGLNLGAPPHLVTIDPSVPNITDLGTTVPNIDGIAFVPAPAAPSLTIQSVTNSIVIGWPASASGYRLLQNTNITSTNWVANTNSTNVVGGKNQVTVSPTNTQTYFRLVNP